MIRLAAALLVVVISSGCTGGPLAPNCGRRTGSVMADTPGTAPAGSAASYDVTSPIDSNLVITLTWNDPEANVGLRAMILDCGGHEGCEIGATSIAGRTQPATRELRVDGLHGKQYRVDVLGDANMDQAFTIRVIYDTGACT